LAAGAGAAAQAAPMRTASQRVGMGVSILE
jgi:hypothetical protein